MSFKGAVSVEEKRARPFSIISAVLFLIYGVCFIRDVITDISNAIEFSKINDAYGESSFDGSIVLNIITGIAVAAAVVYVIILLVKNENKKSLALYPAAKIIAGLLTSNFYLMLKNWDMFVHMKFGTQFDLYMTIASWIGYLILLFYIIINCTSKKRENKRWYLPAVIITACRIIDIIIFVVDTPLNSAVASATALSVAEAIIEGAAILTLCLWLRLKNYEGKPVKKAAAPEKKPDGEVITKSAEDPWKDFYWKKSM